MSSTSLLADELATYASHREELLGSSYDRFVLIKDHDVVGTYSSESDAVDDGYRRFGNVPFLVKQIVAVDKPLNFMSGLIRL